jgi:hypothetical protein
MQELSVEASTPLGFRRLIAITCILWPADRRASIASPIFLWRVIGRLDVISVVSRLAVISTARSSPQY